MTASQFLPGHMLMGAKQIAAFLGIRASQVTYLASSGQLPHYRVGRSICANRSALSRWVTEREGATTGQRPSAP